MKKIVAFLFVLLLLGASALTLAEGKTISEYEVVNGVRCKKRQNILTYLLMGIDDSGIVYPKEEEDDIPGQCDMLMLLVIDKAADTYAEIEIDRDTVTPVHAISDYDGSDLGAYPTQIALAHTNGDGMEQSCEVTAQAVSDLLLGVKIDHYAAVNMDAIRIINRSVGGVTITLEDDFSKLDSAMKKGATIRLSDAQAELFLRGRMSVGDGSNVSRMRRQGQFIDAIKPLMKEKYKAKASFPLDLAHSLSPYMVTDMTDKDFSYIAKALSKNSYLGRFRPTGVEGVDDDNFAMFFPDKDSIAEIVMKLFYIPADQ